MKLGAEKTSADKNEAQPASAEKVSAERSPAGRLAGEKTARRATRSATKTAPVEASAVEFNDSADRGEAADGESEPTVHLSQEAATDLLVRALRITESRGDDDWVGNSQLKNQMLRMDPSFKEKSLGFKSFTGFVESRAVEVEIKEGAPTNQPRLRLRDRD